MYSLISLRTHRLFINSPRQKPHKIKLIKWSGSCVFCPPGTIDVHGSALQHRFHAKWEKRDLLLSMIIISISYLPQFLTSSAHFVLVQTVRINLRDLLAEWWNCGTQHRALYNHVAYHVSFSLKIFGSFQTGARVDGHIYVIERIPSPMIQEHRGWRTSWCWGWKGPSHHFHCSGKDDVVVRGFGQTRYISILWFQWKEQWSMRRCCDIIVPGLIQRSINLPKWWQSSPAVFCGLRKCWRVGKNLPDLRQEDGHAVNDNNWDDDGGQDITVQARSPQYNYASFSYVIRENT